MEILDLKKLDKNNAIKKAVNSLQSGKLIIYPTETCYGIAADTTNPQAITKLLNFKGNRSGKAISIAVSDQDMAEQYVKLNSQAKSLYQKFLPGPLTIISQSKKKVDSRLESPNQTLGIRIPNYLSTLKLIQKFNKPITSTSANSSGIKQPYSLQDFQKYTAKKSQKLASLFLNAGKLKKRPSSTVVDTTLQEPKILRKGTIKLSSSAKTTITKSPQETQNLANQLLQKNLPKTKNKPLIFALYGKLGAGKTCFTKGLAKALKINQKIKSPTYTIIHEYQLSTSNTHLSSLVSNHYFYHLDTWRLHKPEELLNLGLEKMLQPGNILAVEWSEKFIPILKKISQPYHLIKIKIDIKSNSQRKISWSTK